MIMQFDVYCMLSALLCIIMCLIHLQVHVRVEIPTKLNNEERKIVEELKEIQQTKPAKKKFSLF